MEDWVRCLRIKIIKKHLFPLIVLNLTIFFRIFLSLLKPQNFHEYFDYEFLKKEMKILDKNSIYHIPTWRMNLIMDVSVDLITSIFVYRK